MVPIQVALYYPVVGMVAGLDVHGVGPLIAAAVAAGRPILPKLHRHQEAITS